MLPFHPHLFALMEAVSEYRMLLSPKSKSWTTCGVLLQQQPWKSNVVHGPQYCESVVDFTSLILELWCASYTELFYSPNLIKQKFNVHIYYWAAVLVFVILYVWLFYMHLCIHSLCVPGAYGSKNEEMDTLELELQVDVNFHVSSRNLTWVLRKSSKDC